MFTVAELRALQDKIPGSQFFIHDGYNGWSYGSPLNPTPITPETACRLLNRLARSISEAGLRAELGAGQATAIEYAKDGDSLFKQTHDTRFLAFLPAWTCSYRDDDDNPTPGPSKFDPIDMAIPDLE